MIPLSVSELIERFSHYKDSATIENAFIRLGATKLKPDEQRRYVVLRGYIIKISRQTKLHTFNVAEYNMWQKASKLPEFANILQPVEYISRNFRILVMKYIPTFDTLSEAKSKGYIEFERKLSTELDLYLTYPAGTASDLSKVIHYPYTYTYPNKIAAVI